MDDDMSGWPVDEIKQGDNFSQDDGFAVDGDTLITQDLLDEIGSRPLDLSGKADDAIDFADIDLSDDELPDEEPALPGLTDDGGTSNDTDDLFGENPGSSPLDPIHGGRSSPIAEESLSIEQLRNLNFNFDDDENAASESNQDPNIPPAAETLLDTVKQAFPAFKENAICNWNELLYQRKATWNAKKPVKLPKSLIPSKLSLEVEPDQRALFRLPGPAFSVNERIKTARAHGLVSLIIPEAVEQADLEVFNDESDSETIGGYTLTDIATICDDWESMIRLGDELASHTEPNRNVDRNLFKEEHEADNAEWDMMFLYDEPPAKRRKVEIPRGLPPIPRFTAPNFDNFEEATAKLGKRVILDMNDPYLLIDDAESEQRAAKRRKVQHKTVRMANGKVGRELLQRFDFSSDAAYDALKENNQNRVRATLSEIRVEHSMPAQRLAYPYFQVRLHASDPHSYHRPQIRTEAEAFSTIRFTKPNFLKRKATRGKRIPEIFGSTHDLSMNDNSTAVLLEYCEEIPTVLSNVGMGQKIVNYHRRSKGAESRPEKHELGEPVILMPEDRSPFAIFGQVNPGEVVPTLHNKMFRAPIFKHTPKSTDFLVGCTKTGQQGSSWYIRNIDHLYVVGQNLPSMEVPGPHSRKVTNIAKNRLKMVSYRILRHREHVTLHDITRHVAESNESQNRSKLREFLDFRKDAKIWQLKEGDSPKSEEYIRSLVTPEDVCLLDAMQVGNHELAANGYGISKDDVEDEDIPPESALAQKMAPWRLTKAFLDASHGKAMVAVHGDGDPTGKGLGVSFLRTSMKGGYLEALQGPLATSADAIERQRKANGGHMYNVKNQDILYTEALTGIWNRQRESLEDSQEHDDDDVLEQEDEDDRFNVQGQTPARPTQADGVSQVSQRSAANAAPNQKKLKITREVVGEDGKIQTVVEIVHDPVVVAQYTKKRYQKEVKDINIYEVKKLTGNPEQDRVLLKMAHKETERLLKNRERRKKREKQKQLQNDIAGTGVGASQGNGDGASPEPSTEKATGTTRKCANCGIVGHIKTNKKLCPLLNGSRPRDPNQDDSASLGSTKAPVAASFHGTD
ncbi:hypothetical protein B0H63DRAFT_20465 [Podospora didyma]|uniref:Transcription initiation factor TFIID subunit 1 histone acetyltransferase domain-containing protein n=1 Tax=Podospora didyma TaxID=330526 RepID=A0AAE0U796_9PEZI|nr:hypothetical protein B0H63DRAFT_20465 [Podospora didyma]